MDVAGIASRQRPENDRDLSGRVCRQVAHATASHFNGVLQTWFAVGLKFVTLGDGFQDVLRIAWKQLVHRARVRACVSVTYQTSLRYAPRALPSYRLHLSGQEDSGRTTQ